MVNDDTSGVKDGDGTSKSDYDRMVEERMTELSWCTGEENCLCDECLPV